jgi:hypothetical protein
MLVMHCTQISALEKILGLHYRRFEILSVVFTQGWQISPPKNSHFSTRVEKVRLAKGGARPGAGPKTAVEKQARKMAEDIAREFIEKNLKPVLKVYKQLAGGRPVKHYNQKTGEHIYTEIEVDTGVLKHYMDRVIPPRAPEDRDRNAVPPMGYFHDNLESED